MSKLNCGVGDLAITVHCVNPENMGNIDYILRPRGYKQCNHMPDKVFTWEVLAIGENSWLLYEIDDWPVSKKIGNVPDYCLRRITPPKGTSKKIKKNSHKNPQQGILDLTAIGQEEINQAEETLKGSKRKK